MGLSDELAMLNAEVIVLQWFMMARKSVRFADGILWWKGEILATKNAEKRKRLGQKTNR